LDLFLAGSDLPPPELSDDALPQSWAEIVRAYAAVAEAPPDYVAIAAIAGAAGAIGNAYVVEGKRGWREPAVLWGMPIGPPSAHKTPAMKAAHSALAAIDHELYVEWKRECEQIEVQHQMALDAQEAANKPKKSVKKPEKPPLKHLLHDDTSLEKLTINMAASPHGAVAFYSELAAWFASFSRYSGSGDDSSGRALWNRAYDAERFKRDRVKNEGPPIVVPAAACSVVGAIQPDKLRQIWPKSHDGLLARPIYVWPRLAPLPSEETDNDGDDGISGGVTYAFRKAFKALYDLPLVVDDEGVPHPAVLRLASEARSPFNVAKRDCERRARRERGLIGEWLGKGPGRVLRLALTFQLMTWSLNGGGAPPPSIGLDALDRAIRYFHYAEAMLRRTLAGLEPTRSAEDALAVAKQIVKKRWRHFTNYDVGREQGFRWFRGEDAENKRRRDNALNVLIDAKAIRQDLVQTGRGVIQKRAVNPDLGEKISDL
jgi:putative DNA primase/helicase